MSEYARARLVLDSANRKTGCIPVSYTERRTCPPSCPWFRRGCYAETGHLLRAWREVQFSGDPWPVFCATVAALPEGTLWRHNVAGDLPGDGDRLDADALLALARANRGRRGFTFTAKPLLREREREAVEEAVRLGFAVNLSAADVREADRRALLGFPVVCVLPFSFRPRRTPAGRRVLVCPGSRGEATCGSCGLCAVPGRRDVIGFPAHGTHRNRVHLAVAQTSFPGLP